MATGETSKSQRLFAVVESKQRTDKSSVCRQVADFLGPAYVPDEVLTLADLKLEAFPVNATHKVQKSELLAAIDQCQ